MSININELGDKIAELKGTTPFREMAEKTGVSHTYLRSLIVGDTHSHAPVKPNPDKLKLIAEAYPFKTSYKELMTLAGYADQVDSDPNKETKNVDLKQVMEDEDVLLSYDGKPIPEEYAEMIKKLLS